MGIGFIVLGFQVKQLAKRYYVRADAALCLSALGEDGLFGDGCGR